VGDDLFSVVPDVSTEALGEMSRRDEASEEIELLGYPVSLDPFTFWMEDLERNGTIRISELENYVGREMEIAGIQVCHRLHRTLKGDLMKFISLADESGIAETVLFPDAYRAFGWPLSRSRAARLRVSIERDETGSGLSLMVTEALSAPHEYTAGRRPSQ
jgi:DNA polymerase III alpha subunit